MNVQSVILWAARLACPLAFGLIAWWLFRQPGEAQQQLPAQRLRALQRRRATLEAEIDMLEAHSSESAPADKVKPAEPEAV